MHLPTLIRSCIKAPNWPLLKWQTQPTLDSLTVFKKNFATGHISDLAIYTAKSYVTGHSTGHILSPLKCHTYTSTCGIKIRHLQLSYGKTLSDLQRPAFYHSVTCRMLTEYIPLQNHDAVFYLNKVSWCSEEPYYWTNPSNIYLSYHY